jgi:hypothetical protein
MKKLSCIFSAVVILTLLILILYNPKICLNTAVAGLVLCGRVIIPSLYPFTFCVLFILKSGVLNSLKFLNKSALKLWGLDFSSFSLFLLSLIGGYPLGAKMLNDAKTPPKTASVMINYCVNAGPAFIILTVGNGVFYSNKIGVLLFVAHLLPPVFMAFLYKNKIKSTTTPTQNLNSNFDLIDNFVTSASDGASAIISVCSFVILFSVICGYINSFPSLKPLSFILEITNGISQTNNIYIISFLLGFGGICVWCQVFSLFKRAKIKILRFFISRLFHGFASAVITFLLLKIFKITLPTLSNGKIFDFSPFFQSQGVGVSLIITGLLLIISLTNKNFAGNLLKDVV